MAHQILDENRQQLRLVECGVGLPQRVVNRRPHLPLHFVTVESARGRRRRLVVQSGQKLLDSLAFPNLDAKRRPFVEGAEGDRGRLLERFLDLVQ